MVLTERPPDFLGLPRGPIGSGFALLLFSVVSSVGE
jgi:hypothetical protein